MSRKRTLKEFEQEFRLKFPDKQYIKFLERTKRHFIVEDKFGICKIAICHLMNGYCPTIRVAIDKDSYFINKAKNVHRERYDYSKAKYKGLDTNLTLICSKHGEFETTPHSHIGQKAGCSKCGYEKNSITNGENPLGWGDTDWFKKAKTSNYFESFKTYIILCWDENERFYKIGKTFRTMKERFPKHDERMPYDYEIVQIFEYKGLSLESAKEASIKERELKTINKENKYLPLRNIRGKFECFNQIINLK